MPFAVDITPKSGLTHFAGANFTKGSVYGSTVSTMPDNEYLLAMFGYINENNPYDMMQFTMKNSMKLLNSKLKAISKVVRYWDDSLNFEDAAKRDELYFTIRRDVIPNNKLMNYLRILQLMQYNTSKTEDDLLSMYRNSSMFSPENEKRALASYYNFFRIQLEKYPHTMSGLQKMQVNLVEDRDLTLSQAKDKENSKAVESLQHRINSVQSSIELLDMHYDHMKNSLLKLGAISYIKLEHTLQGLSEMK